MASKKTKEKKTYTYYCLDGQTHEIEVGKDGVTEELMEYLNTSDDEIRLQERYKRENDDPLFQRFMRQYECNRKSMDNPIEQIMDESADIMSILYPEDQPVSPISEAMTQVLGMLTEDQRDLIWEAYGLQKGDTEIAREQHVTRVAIHNRRVKIMKRVEILLKEVMAQKH